jgi:hypothetical protein
MTKKEYNVGRDLKDCLPNLPLRQENQKRKSKFFYHNKFGLP